MTYPSPSRTQPIGCGFGRSDATPVPSAAPACSVWEALLSYSGLVDNRSYRPVEMVRRSAPLYVGTPVRVARSSEYGHGRDARTVFAGDMPPDVRRRLWRVSSDHFVEQYNRIHAFAGDSGIDELLARDRALVAAAGDDPAPLEPQVVGRVIASRYEPYEGVICTIEFDPVPIEGPLVWIGAVGDGEPITEGFARLSRMGLAGLLRLSYVVTALGDEGTGPDGEWAFVYREIKAVQFIDVVMYGASRACLIRPIEGK
jgi:hypothetical protein